MKKLMKLVSKVAMDPRSDRDLLLQFAASRDSDAMSELFQRHAAAIRMVAADVFPNAADEVVQAAFIFLAERADSLTNRDSAAGWLFQVARRLALKARAAAACRSRYEAGAASPESPTSPLDEIVFREVRGIVAEELTKLPERLRVPLVLHYWEGATHAEAAERLKCSVSTVKRILDAGREHLGARLARRGMTGASVLTALTALHAQSAAARPLLAVPPGSSVDSGVPRFGSLPATGLLRVAGSVGIARRLAVTASLLVAIVAISFGLIAATDNPAPPIVERAEPKVVGVAPVPREPQKLPAADPEDPKFAGHFSGRVNGPDGKPLAGAKVFIVPYHRENKDAGLVRATTDADGRFTFDAPDMTYTEFDGLPARREGLLVATKDGLGPDWQHTWGHSTGRGLHTHYDPDKGDEVKLQLAKDDVPIRGRFLGPDGKSLAGARVRLTTLQIPTKRDLDAHLAFVIQEGAAFALLDYEREIYELHLLPGLTTETRTDADGRFTLAGIGRDRLAVLTVSAPSIADTTVTVMTRAAADVPARPIGKKFRYIIHGASFTLKLERGLTAKGVVRDRDTKAPVPGMWVTKYWNPLTNPSNGDAVTVTDKNGRFTIEGLSRELPTYPKEQCDLTAIPRPGSQYLMGKGFIEGEADVVIECVRGIQFRLKLVDEQGKPAEGNVEYWPIDPNPQIEDLVRPLHAHSNWPVMSRAARQVDGTYLGFVMPGPGAVVVEMPHRRSYRPANVDPKAFFEPSRTKWPENSFSIYGTHNTFMSGGGWIDQHDYAAIVLVNPAKGAGPLDLSATVVRDRPRQVSLIDPDGKPVVGAVAHLYEKHGPYKTEEHLRAGSFPLTGLLPDRVQRITFVQEERKLIGVLKARADGETPYTVQMQPWGTVTGRFVDADGKPMTLSVGNNGEGPVMSNHDLEGSPFYRTKVDEDGKFRIDGLFPGQSYTCDGIFFFLSPRLAVTGLEKLVLRSGEVRDVGNIRTKPAAKGN